MGNIGVFFLVCGILLFPGGECFSPSSVLDSVIKLLSCFRNENKCPANKYLNLFTQNCIQFENSNDEVRGDCPDNMHLELMPNTTTLSCFCNVRGLEVPLIYVAQKKQCYQLFDQGPCRDDQVLMMNGSKAGCAPDPCLNMDYSEDDRHIVVFEGKCSRLGDPCGDKGKGQISFQQGSLVCHFGNLSSYTVQFVSSRCPQPKHRSGNNNGHRGSGRQGSKHSQSQGKYPLTAPVATEKGSRYRIGIISDLDHGSKTFSGKWMSYLRRGNLYLKYNAHSPKDSKVELEWDSGEPLVLKSELSQKGRGMELSTLTVFNGKLYSCDDRTGIVYNLESITSDEIVSVPWAILADGNGTSPKGFKCEWSCVKDGYMYVGGLGKEWTTTTGELINLNPQYVKKISTTGEVEHLSWVSNYNKMSKALNIYFPGYVIHESGGWSEVLQKWVFLPRRASPEQYDDKTDETKGTNIMMVVNEDFSNVEVRHVGDIVPTQGFSSFKWIPGTNDQLIIALKSEEFDGNIATYAMVTDMNGNILMSEAKVGDQKYEGVEFL